MTRLPVCLLASRDPTRQKLQRQRSCATRKTNPRKLLRLAYSTTNTQIGTAIWLGVKLQTKEYRRKAKANKKTTTLPFRIAENRRPTACSPDRGYTSTRVGGAHCTWWRARQPIQSECTLSCCVLEATSAPWAGSPDSTSCLPYLRCRHSSRFYPLPWAEINKQP